MIESVDAVVEESVMSEKVVAKEERLRECIREATEWADWR